MHQSAAPITIPSGPLARSYASRAGTRLVAALGRAGAIAALATAPLIAVGCGSEAPAPKAPPQPVSGLAGQTGTSASKSGPAMSPTSSAVRIDDRIVKACGNLPTARFAFDSASVANEAASLLDALARCFTTGPLEGKGMRLVGHADPRGETEYNLGLGQRRAGSVAEFLAKKGMEKERMATSSKGEFEASGTDESSWAEDRKVDVLLAE